MSDEQHQVPSPNIDEVVANVTTTNATDDDDCQYSCKRCRAVLFTTTDVLFHDATKNSTGHKKFKHQNFHSDEQKEECTSVFLDPDVNPWVAAEARMQALYEEGADDDGSSSSASSSISSEGKKEKKVVTGATGAYAHLNGTTYDSDSESWVEDEEDGFWGDDDDGDVYDPEEDEENDVPLEKFVVDTRPEYTEASIKDIVSNHGSSVKAKKKKKKNPSSSDKKKATTTAANNGAPVVRVEDFVPEADTVYCPNTKCRSKIGAQSWIGSQCSCGAWVTPSFKIHAKCLDKVPMHMLK